jgi:hypothetical protein
MFQLVLSPDRNPGTLNSLHIEVVFNGCLFTHYKSKCVICRCSVCVYQNLRPRMKGGSGCQRESVAMKQQRHIYVSVGTVTLTFTDEKSNVVGGNDSSVDNISSSYHSVELFYSINRGLSCISPDVF